MIVGLTGSLLYSSRHFVLLPILTRGLGTVAYGRWELLLSASLPVMVYLLLGLGTALVRFHGGERSSETAAKRQLVGFHVIVLALGGCWLIGAQLAAEPIARRVFGDPTLLPLVRLFSLLPVVTALDELCIAYFQARQAMGVRAGFLIGELLLLMVGIWRLLETGWGLTGVLMWAVAVKAILWAAKLAWILRGVVAPSFERLGASLAFGAFMVIGSSCYQLIGAWTRLLIGRVLGMADVGLYGAAYLLGSLVLLFVAPIEYALFPVLAGYWNADDHQAAAQQVAATVYYTGMIAGAVALVVSVFSHPLLTLMASQEFERASSTVPWIALGCAIYGSSLALERVVLFRRPWGIALTYAVALLTNTLLSRWLIPRWGLIGAGVSWCGACVSHFAITLFLAKAQLPVRVNGAAIGKTLAAGLVVFILSRWMLPALTTHVFFGACLAVAGYAALLAAMGMVDLRVLVRSGVLALSRRMDGRA